ncbi:MAG: hypothetical protein Q4D58_10260 [Synergistaceae bacterium]|nr:hypothetical protein [Synergistaceae bacterium]
MQGNGIYFLRLNKTSSKSCGEMLSHLPSGRLFKAVCEPKAKVNGNAAFLLYAAFSLPLILISGPLFEGAPAQPVGERCL